MALYGDRVELDYEMGFFMNEAGNRGGVVTVDTAGSGIALDQGDALCKYPATASGTKPLGILLNDVVDINQTRQHINWYKDEVIKGGKVTILRKGWVVTDQIASGVTPSAGDPAYLGNAGRITSTNTGEAASPKIGQFLSKKDENGYAKVSVNL